MAKLEKTRYPSVYKRVGINDTSFIIKYKIAGKLNEEVAGKESDGMTAKKASEILDVRKNHNLDKKVEVANSVKAKKSFQNLAKSYFDNLYLEANKESEVEDREKKKKTFKNIKREESVYKKFWGDWNLKMLPIAKIRQEQVLKHINSKKNAYSDKSIYNALTVAKSIMKHTAKEHSDLNNPFMIDEYKKAKKNNNRKEYLTQSQCSMLLNHLRDCSTFKNYVLVLTSLMTGARPNSVLTLKVEDIDFRKNEIKFYDYKRKMPYYSKITKELALNLKKQVEDLKRQDYVFFNDDPSVAYSSYPSSIQTVLDKLFNAEKDEDEERIVPYTLRHTFANLLLQVHKVPVFEVSQLLNHANISTTIDHYITFNHDLVVKDLNHFENAITQNHVTAEELLADNLKDFDLDDDVILKIIDRVKKLDI